MNRRGPVPPGAPAGTIAVTRVEPAMGTVFSMTVTAAAGKDSREGLEQALEAAARWLHEVDDRFTTYRSGSEWLRFVDGEIGIDDAHPDIRLVVGRCAELSEDTEGAFSVGADPSRPADPAAYVKGWATGRAVGILLLGGADTVFLNGGGDIAVSARDRPWRIAVQDPFVRDRIRAVVELDEGAVATSGHYERGAHICDPRTGRAAGRRSSVTVTGPDLGTADALSTALFASDGAPDAWFDDFEEYGAYLLDSEGRSHVRGRIAWSPIVPDR